MPYRTLSPPDPGPQKPRRPNWLDWFAIVGGGTLGAASGLIVGRWITIQLDQLEPAAQFIAAVVIVSLILLCLFEVARRL